MRQIDLLKLLALGALLPLLAMALLLWAGLQALGACRSWLGAGLLGVGALLLANGGYGWYLSVKSWATPKGHRVGSEEAPELTAWLQACSSSWQGPRMEAVVLDSQSWSLYLIGTPTLGVLGWARFHWVVGLYPLLALSLRELEAVASWEAVWWSDQQGWLNLQAKRLANHWQSVYLQLWEEHPSRLTLWCTGLLRPYARWMVRQLEGFLVRECLWADATTAQQHGAATFGRALCRLAILKPLMDRRLLPELLASLQAGEPLPEYLYDHLAQGLARCPEHVEGLLDLAMDGLLPEAPPLLRLRLGQLGVAAQAPLPPENPAFRSLLEGTPVLQDLETALKARILAQMDKAALRKAEEDQAFGTLQAMVVGRLAKHPRALDYLHLAIDRLSSEAFWDQLVAFCEGNPSHPDGKLLILKWTLRKGWVPQAETQVQQMLIHNPFLAPACHNLLAAHHRNRGALAQAEREGNLARRAEDLLQRARRERGSASLGDSLEPHGCGASQLEPMVSYLKAQGDLGEAFLVRKKVAVHPELPVLLLVVRPQSVWWDPGGRKREACQARIEREFPFPGSATGHVLVVRAGLLWRYRRMLTGLGARILIRKAS